VPAHGIALRPWVPRIIDEAVSQTPIRQAGGAIVNALHQSAVSQFVVGSAGFSP
jgi:hypothetical protein